MSEEAGSLIWLPGRLWGAVHRCAHAGTISWKRSLLLVLERQPWLLTVSVGVRKRTPHFYMHSPKQMELEPHLLLVAME